MYKIKLGNFVLTVLLVILSLVIGIGTGYLQLFILPLPVWLLLSALVIFIIGSMVLYPSAQIKDLIMLSFFKFGVYAITMVVIIATLLILGKTEIKPNLVMDLSMFSIIIPIFFAMGSIKAAIKIEKTILETKVEVPVETNSTQVSKTTITNVPANELPTQMTEQISETMEPAKIEVKQAVKEEIITETSSEKIIETVKKEEVTSAVKVTSEVKQKTVKEEEKTPEVILEDIADVSFEKKSAIQEETKETVIIQKEEPKIEPIKPIEIPIQKVEQIEEPADLLGDLPDLSGELDTLVSLDDETTFKEEESITPFKLEDIEEKHQQEQTILPEANVSTAPTEFIDYTTSNPSYVKPEIPKLVDTPKPKEKTSGGKITSIGKLLVDQRDLENIIETNALMQHIASDGTTTQIISTSAGNKTNEKVKEIEELGHVKTIIIVNDAGFVQKSTLQDIHKEQLLGAMTSGTFGILSSLLKKLGFQLAKDIVFETETGWSILSKHSSDIYSIFIEPGKPLYKTTSLNEKIHLFNPQNKNEFIAKISATVGIIGTVIASEHGDLIASKLVDDSKDPHDVAVMLPSFYSNTNILAKNMNQGQIKNIIINTGNNILLVSSIKSHILLLYSTVSTAIIPEDYKNKLDAIINK